MDISLFGHRGAAGEAPENTLGGFAYAWEIGVRAFELDIHLSKDEQLVVIHDPTLERTTDGVGLVSDYTAAELSSLNAACRFPGWSNREGVPSLQNVLARYHTGIHRWQLEIKTDAPRRLEVVCKILARQIDHFDIYERVKVTSFDPAALQIMRRTAPHLILGLIRSPMLLEDIDLAQTLGCSEVCMPVESGGAWLVSAAHEAGLEVTGWLGNNPTQMERLLAWGVDAITTDVPSFAQQYMNNRSNLE